MTEPERLFRQIVRNLAATNPARLRQPLRLADIRDSIAPYRTNRRALQLETSEDYEMALMRLCSGEGGLARTDPAEIRDTFAAEVVSNNPDLTLVERNQDAVLMLDGQAVTRVLDPNPNRVFAPPEPVTETPAPVEQSRSVPPDPMPKRSKTSASEPSSTLRQCLRCGSSLPTGRVVNFCPQCGLNLTRLHCPQCNTELELGWRHCVSCGTPLTGH